EAALNLMDEPDPDANRVGAVNTVIFRNGKMEGRNTDGYGFAENLRAAGVDVKNETVTVLGAGGAARAVVAALSAMDAGCVRTVNRRRERAVHFGQAFPGLAISLHDLGDAQALRDAALLVNATSLGMQGQPAFELSLDALPASAAVTDLVYAPLETELL